jgi:hypothetical protein
MAMVFPTSPTVGQVFTSGSRSWVWNGSAWDSPSAINVLQVPYGLELIRSQAIGVAVNTITVTDVFSATYDNYLIQVSGASVTSGGDSYLLRFNNSSGSTYLFAGNYMTYGGTNFFFSSGLSGSTGISIGLAARNATMTSNTQILRPFSPSRTVVCSQYSGDEYSGQNNGFDNNVASHTGFSIFCPAAITGGTINVYGYRKE